MRLFWLIGSLAVALALAVVSVQVPTPRPADAPATVFSTERAMVDIRQIAQRPHPIGSPDHARVQVYLQKRMQALGLTVTTQTGPISENAARYLRRMGGNPEAANFSATNLIGVLPGRNPALPAVALMAHYDTVPMSPGAADDSTGVAALLEAVRAIQARGPADRTLVLLLTDSEELGLDGARNFFSDHPLRDRIGAVVNLEARGGGGRAMMFETGKGNAETIALFASAGTRADGGVTSNALAVFVYSVMPNGSDFTIPRQRGVQGMNFAFIGRPEQYHTPASTVANLDPGSVQHIGSQALETADALLRAPTLPKAGADIVYADLFGRVIVMHPPVWGWGILLLATGLLALAVIRVRKTGHMPLPDLGRGVVDGLWFLSVALVLTQAVRVVGGPMAARTDSAGAYYTLLARLPWLEAGVALAVLALALLLIAGRHRLDRRGLAGGIALAVAVALLLGGFDRIILGAGIVALGLSLVPASAAKTTWGGWTGLILLVLTVGLIAQAFAPQTAFLFLWPGLLVALVAAIAAHADTDLKRSVALVPIAMVSVLAGGWLLGLSHPVFLGIGMDLPGVLALMGLLVLMTVRALGPEEGSVRPLMIAAAVVLTLGVGVSAWARIAEPMALEKARAGTADT